MICAICTTEAPTHPTDLDGNGVLFDVCVRCNEEHPRGGGYSFDGGRIDVATVHVTANALSTVGNASGRRPTRKAAR